jgi:hypothetical protein
MRCDPALALFISDALVNQPVHPQDDLIGGQTRLGIGGSAQLAVDRVADALEDAAH